MRPKARLWIILVCALLILSTSACMAKVVYVKTTGSDSNDGLSWDTAKKTIRAGITAAVADDEVHVAQGKYVESVGLKDRVPLLGGYLGEGDARDPKTYVTTIECADSRPAVGGQGTYGYVTTVFRVDGFTIQGSHYTYCAVNVTQCVAYVTNNVIRSNATGGIYYTSGLLTTDFGYIANNKIVGNTGMGIQCYGGSATIVNNVVAGNCISVGLGGGIYCSSANATIVNNTIAGNQAPSGGGGIILDVRSGGATVANNIVAFNTGGITGPTGSAITLSHNCVYENAGLDYGFGSVLTPGEGDISVDPKLASLTCGDYHIQPGSPCIGAGDNSAVQPDVKDMDGQDRVLPTGGIVDIGADESNGETWTPASTGIIRVTPTGNDANDGSAWDDAHAKQTVQAAINAASAYGEVWVKAGTYNERIYLRSLVNVYGGFAGSETDLSQRDPKANATILDGQQAGTVVTAQDVVQGTTLDGFTVRNGKISTNGGGMYLTNASPTISGNTITGCTASVNGGGIYLVSSSSPVIEGNLITGNTASSGGGIYSYGAWPVIRGNTISANNGVPSGINSTRCDGAGIYLYMMQGSGRVSVIGNTIAGNLPGTGHGGGINVSANRLSRVQLLFDGNTVTDNWSPSSWFGAPTGEGIYGGCRTMVVTNNTIARNAMGVNLSGGTLTMSGNRIFGGLSTSSTAVTLGCPGSFRNNLIAGNPTHALSCGSMDVVNNTIINNGGTGISCASMAAGSKLENNIVAFNGGGISKGSASSPTIQNNCVYQNNGLDYKDGAVPGPGDISVDPMFASLQYANIHLQPGSPCIDAGDSSVIGSGWTDLEGQARIQGGAVDIGADESDGISRPDVPNAIVRVSPSGDDANDGSTWALAKKTVQAGLAAAGAVGGEAWVKAGTYNERVTVGACTSLLGGFDGTEIEKSQRNWSLNKTVLDGQRKDCVVKMAGAVYTTVDGFTIQNGFADLRGAAVYISGKNALLSHNTITRNAPSYYAATVAYDYSSTTIAANNIVGNAGYAIRPHSDTFCTPTITGNTIVGNGLGVGGYRGGTLTNNLIAFNGSGISGQSSIPLSMSHNCVYGNVTDYSGTPDQTGTNGNISVDPKLADYTYGNVHLQPDSPCIDAGDGSVASGWTDADCQSVQGSAVDIGADESDGASWPQGPNVVLRVAPTGDDANDGSGWDDAHAKKTIQAALDAASLVGGDVWVKAGTYPGSVYLRPFAHLFGGFAGTETDRSQRDWVSNVTTLDGQAHGTVVGGGLGHRVSTIDGFTITNGTGSSVNITNAYIGLCGGGIACSMGGPVIRNNRITGNNVEQGAGIGCVIASPLIVNNLIEGNNGSAIFYYDGRPDVFYNTITGNTGGVLATSDSYSGGSGPRCIGNIAAFNKYGIGFRMPNAYNCNFGNDQYDDQPNQFPELHNIVADPLFVDAANGDYRLTWNSPCVDAGANEYAPDADYLGVFRPIDGNIDLNPVADMGAFEFAPYQVAFSIMGTGSDGHVRIQPNRMLACVILNDGIFPLNQIDISTVTAGPSKAKEAHGKAHWEDANADGVMDMVLHFRCEDAGFKAGDTQISIRGRLTTGEPFIGVYSVAVTGTGVLRKR